MIDLERINLHNVVQYHQAADKNIGSMPVQCHHVADMNINSQRINNCDETTLHYKRCIFACLLKSNLLESNQIYYNIHDLKLRRVKIHDHYTTISNGEALLTGYPAQSSS